MKKPGWMDYLGYGTVRLVLFLLARLPFSVAVGLTRSLAGIYMRWDHRHRKIALINVDIAFPDLPGEEKLKIIRKSYENLGELVAVVSRLPGLMDSRRLQKLVRYEGMEHYHQATANGRSALLLTGHVGCWELLPFAHAVLSRPIHFVVRPLDSNLFDRLLNKYRTMPGNIAIPKKDAFRKILRALSGGADVGILIDQNVQANDGVFVEFFGKKACMTSGLATLALRSGAAVVPVFLVPDPTHQVRYCIYVMPEVPLHKSGNNQADIVENTASYALALEEVIRRWPDQWLWSHRRWKTRPPGDSENIYAGI